MAYSLAQRDGRLLDDRNGKSADGVEFFSRVGATSLHPILALKSSHDQKKKTCKYWIEVITGFTFGYLVDSSSKSSIFACRSCTVPPVPYPFPFPLTTPCPDCTLLSCFSKWATWRLSCCHLLLASNSMFLASSTLRNNIVRKTR